jgi:hypothetical protein
MRASRLSFWLIVLLCTASASGCYTYHVYQIGGADGREMGNQPSTEWKSRTLNAFLWGAVRQDLPVENCQLANGQRLGMEEVKIDKHLGHVLAQALTLGIWVPLKVSWRCNRPVPPTGTLDGRPQ